jgi:hypothetical protein
MISHANLFPMAISFALLSCLPSKAETFSIGIVYADGILLPVASYDGREWGNPWPSVVGEGDPPIQDLASIRRSWLPPDRPLKRRWHLESFDGRSQPLNIRAPTRTTGALKECGDRVWGLVTDTPAMRVECSYCCPFPKIGYAIDRRLPIRRFSPAAQSAPAVARLVESEFNRLEVGEIHRIMSSLSPTWRGYEGFPLERKAREARPLSVDVLTLARSSSGDGFFYYEATRKYPKPASAPDAACEWVSFGRGWIKSIDGRGRPLASSVTLTDCDRKGTESLNPFATIDVGDATHVVAQRFGWESEEVVVLRFGSSVEVLISSPVHGM